MLCSSDIDLIPVELNRAGSNVLHQRVMNLVSIREGYNRNEIIYIVY